jgi:hypothetical protein
MSGVRKDPMPRFFSRVTLDQSGCWRWTGALSAGGYGVFQETPDHPQTSAHRVAYEWAHGRLPGRHVVVDHLCRNRWCVNPAHLEAVTQKENMRRGIKGELTTHCPHGHEYTDWNTYVYTDSRGTYRKCRACHAERESLRRRTKASTGISSRGMT